MWEFPPNTAEGSIDIFIPDSGSTTGAGKTGLAYNTASLTCYYRRGHTGTPTSVTLATQTVGGGWSSGGFVEVDATNMPGLYRFDIPAAALAKTPNEIIKHVIFCFKGASGMAPVFVRVNIAPEVSAKWAILYCEVDNTAFTPTTTAFETDSNDLSATYDDSSGGGNADDKMIGRSVVFRTGRLAGRAATITAYSKSGSRARITVDAMPAAPSDGDAFIIV